MTPLKNAPIFNIRSETRKGLLLSQIISSFKTISKAFKVTPLPLGLGYLLRTISQAQDVVDNGRFGITGPGEIKRGGNLEVLGFYIERCK